MQDPITRHFGATLSLGQLGPAQRRLIVAMRQIVLHGKARSCPMAVISPLLGGTAQAKAYLRIIFMVGNVWPEAVRVLCPCSKAMTYDEALLIDMIDRAVHRDGPGFDALLCDMLGSEARAELFGEILAFSAAYIGPAPRHAI